MGIKQMSIPSNITRFRPAILPAVIFIFFFGMAGALCYILPEYGPRFVFRGMPFATVVALVFSFVWSLVVSFAFPAGFSTDGIYGHSFWGLRRFVRWQDVAKAKTFWMVNLPWLRIYGTDGKVTWVALFQVRKNDFKKEIQRLSPSGNPVLQHL